MVDLLIEFSGRLRRRSDCAFSMTCDYSSLLVEERSGEESMGALVSRSLEGGKHDAYFLASGGV